jgi:putative glycosyltransferase (TIGR04372 family)
MISVLSNLYRSTVILVFALILLPLLYLIDPIWRFRFFVLWSDRIGHLMQFTEILYYRDMNPLPPRTTYLFFSSPTPSNRQILKMFKRKFHIFENIWLLRAILAAKPLLAKTRFFVRQPRYADRHHLLKRNLEPLLSFTENEMAMGTEFLRKLGIGKNDWYVCLHARDPAYIGQRSGFGQTVYKSHIRDCPIEDMSLAIKRIVDKGGYVIRMGAIVANPLPDMGPKVIDYASEYRTDFLDAFLLAHCHFYFAGLSGINSIPMMFNRPVGSVNVIPLIRIGAGEREYYYIPKELRHKADQSNVSYPALKKLGLFDYTSKEEPIYHQQEIYDKMGIEWVNNSAEDILELCDEILDVLDGKKPNDDVSKLRKEYLTFHGELNGPLHSGTIGGQYLIKRQHLFNDIASPKST